jgi:hypothetical protein
MRCPLCALVAAAAIGISACHRDESSPAPPATSANANATTTTAAPTSSSSIAPSASIAAAPAASSAASIASASTTLALPHAATGTGTVGEAPAACGARSPDESAVPTPIVSGGVGPVGNLPCASAVSGPLGAYARTCFNQVLKTNPEASGVVAISIDVGPSGTAMGCTLNGFTEVASCMKSFCPGAISFPCKVTGSGSATVHATYSFTTQQK